MFIFGATEIDNMTNGVEPLNVFAKLCGIQISEIRGFVESGVFRLSVVKDSSGSVIGVNTSKAAKELLENGGIRGGIDESSYWKLKALLDEPLDFEDGVTVMSEKALLEYWKRIGMELEVRQKMGELVSVDMINKEFGDRAVQLKRMLIQGGNEIVAAVLAVKSNNFSEQVVVYKDIMTRMLNEALDQTF